MAFNIPDYIKITDYDGTPTAYLNPRADGVKEARVDAKLNGESTFEFYIPSTSKKLLEITPECRIYPGNDREYIILKDEAIDFVRDEKNALWAKVMAVESFFSLNYEFVTVRNDSPDPPTHLHTVTIVSGGSDLSNGLYPVGSAGHALYAILNSVDWAGKTPWTVGTVDVTGVHDLETEKLNVLQNITKIQELWGGYLVWDSINHTVSLRSEESWQNYTGFSIWYRKNLKNITRTQSNRIITRLYVYGADDLNIASVNDGKEYLEDYSFTSKRYSDIITNPDIHDAAQLKEWGLKEFANLSKPRYSYLVKIVDLRTLEEYVHETFSLGDMVDVHDADVGASERIRIVRHAYDLFQPWKCEIELGEPFLRLADVIAGANQAASYIASNVSATGKLSGSKGTVDQSAIINALGYEPASKDLASEETDGLMSKKDFAKLQNLTGLTGDEIVTLINDSESTISDDNLSQNVLSSILSAHVHSNSVVLNAIEEAFTTALKNKLNGIANGATKVENSTTNGNIKINGVETKVYDHPSTHPASMISESTSRRFVSDSKIAQWDNKWDFDEETIKQVKVDNAANADTVNGKTVESNVPVNAKFTDTTYSEISTSEIDAGTSSTLRAITGRRIKYILDKVQSWLNGKADASHSHTAGDLPSASTSAKGLVQLSTSTSSTSTSLAATASAVKAAYDKGNHSHPYAPTTHNHTKSQISDMPTKLSQFENDIGAGAGLNIIPGETEPAGLNPGDWWYEIL